MRIEFVFLLGMAIVARKNIMLCNENKLASLHTLKHLFFVVKAIELCPTIRLLWLKNNPFSLLTESAAFVGTLKYKRSTSLISNVVLVNQTNIYYRYLLLVTRTKTNYSALKKTKN